MFHANGAPRLGITFAPDNGDGAGAGGAGGAAGGSGQIGDTGDDGDDDSDGSGDPVQSAAKLRETLNKERAARRAAERELKPLKTAAQQKADAEKTEAQKAQERADAAEKRAAQLESVVRQGRVERAVRSMDRVQSLGLHDPEFVADLIKLDDGDFDEDGTPDSKVVEAAVRNLVKSKPYLAASGGGKRPGSGDGGASGNSRTVANDMNGMIRRAAGR